MSDEWVSRLCEELTAETWHTELGFGDAPPQLSRRVLQPRISGIDSFLDVALLRKRLEEMEHGASPPEAAMLYLKLWRAHEDVSD